MAGITKDGIASTEILVETISGLNSLHTSGTFAQLTATNFTATNPVSGTNVSKEYPVAYVGSPVLGNLAIEFGTNTNAQAAGTVQPVVFAKPFAAAPLVFLQPATLVGSVASVHYVSGTISTGSFVYYGGSNVLYAYMAVGSGRI